MSRRFPGPGPRDAWVVWSATRRGEAGSNGALRCRGAWGSDFPGEGALSVQKNGAPGQDGYQTSEPCSASLSSPAPSVFTKMGEMSFEKLSLPSLPPLRTVVAFHAPQRYRRSHLATAPYCLSSCRPSPSRQSRAPSRCLLCDPLRNTHPLSPAPFPSVSPTLLADLTRDEPLPQAET